MKVFTRIWLVICFFFSALSFDFTPTVVFDLAAPGDAVSSRASGYLYGLAEAGVPDSLTVGSLSPASVSQKVPNGLQHPVGDIAHVAPELQSADYLVVYLQDCFSTWYYANDEINEMRAEGTYDWQAFLTERFFPEVTKTVRTLSATEYKDRVVYCLYNECDNGVWFGESFSDTNGVYGAFNDKGKETFFDAWAQTYRLVKSLAPDALIGGPGYYEFNADKERDFLAFCKANGCLPEIMIYHELNERSAELWREHVTGYREIEAALGVSPLPVIVTEYGTMAECGNPAEMIRYITAIEESGVYGDIAFWRLADNLNDNAADGNMPNSCWWLYRWYAAMDGKRLSQQKYDLFHADFAKAVKEGRQLKYKTFDTLGCLSEDGKRIDVVAGHCGYTGSLVFKNLSAADLGKKVHIRIEAVPFSGLSGAVTAPAVTYDAERCVTGGTLSVDLKDMDPDAVYHICVTPASGETVPVTALPLRFEAERGALLGGAYTYRSAYAATGDDENLVGGMENPGDGVELTVSVRTAGSYDLAVIYGKANDGASPDGRVTGKAKLFVNGEEQTLLLPNTIKSEYTSVLHTSVRLKKGKNTLRFEHGEGTFVLDGALVSPEQEPEALALLPDTAANGETAYLAVAPTDGYYTVSAETTALTVDGADAGGVSGEKRVCLRRGLNRLTLAGEGLSCRVSNDRTPLADPVLPSQITLTAPAQVDGDLLTGITSEGGAAAFSVQTERAGDWRLTLCYSNNQEGGYHAYNVDLIEAYVTLETNGQTKTVMCRNTYSRETFSTVTVNLSLCAGENEIRLYNGGEIRFDGRTAVAPEIRWVSVNPAAEA
ncbi:MAG: hypothetical protein IJJ85_07345 [Clostridia bacterium]|nr:hypothetical protein [Clostridia bacterium]